MASGDDRQSTIDDPAFLTRYQPRVDLGAGSSGEVQLWHDRRIGRDVAVKVLRPAQSSDHEARVRFLREARLQGQLEHPGVVPVYELAESDGERPWFTMQRVRGITLAEVIAGLAAGDELITTPFTRNRALAAFAQVCRTLDFAHAQGVVHRDLSPRNVMLGDYGEVLVLDWGLARFIDQEKRARANEEDDLSETRPGSALGTPGYMAPEQALGDPEVGPEADVYALGVMLFEILTSRPFNPGTTTRERIDLAIRGIDPKFPPPEANAGRSVPPELARLVTLATKPHPAERLPSARGLAESVERYLDGDRDLAERRRMADGLVEDARRILAGGGDDPDATRQLARAIALVPQHAEATALLSRILLEPPRTLPAKVRERFAAWAEGAWRSAARIATFRYMFWCAFIPLWFVMGIRDEPAGLLSIASLLAMTAAMGLAAAGVVRGLWGATLAFALGTFAIAGFTQVFSPVLVAPTLMATHLIVYCAYASRLQRALLVVASVAGMGVPIFLEAIGAISPTFVVDETGIHVLPRLVSFEPRLTWWVLVLGATVAVAVPGLIAGRVRDALVAAQQRLLVHTWHLEALVPRVDTREESATRTGES